MEKYNVIGVMSGTSQDGLDIAFCRFKAERQKWSYNIVNAETMKYDGNKKKYLTSLETATAADFSHAHMEVGKYIGEQVNKFRKKYKIKAGLVASHGHTIFHQPSKGFTFQIGSGAAIAAACNLPVVSDFRSLDIALGGQGAPLVPIGDKLLFAGYDYCLNLGGIANISFDKGKKRIAFDICPVNIVLNNYAGKKGLDFDNKGLFAKAGKVNNSLLNKLNKLPYYSIAPGKSKSLGKEWVVDFVYPLINKFNLPVNDTMRTFVEHIALQVARTLNNNPTSKVLITGGGAYNNFLLERIKFYTGCELVLPDDKLIQYKEALVFALLGVLRLKGEINILRSVTGAKADSIGGCIYTN